MAGSRQEKSTIPPDRDPLANTTYSSTRPPIEGLITNTSQDTKPPTQESPKKADLKPDGESATGLPLSDDKTTKRKEKITVLVSADLVERLRNAAWAKRKTLAALAEDGTRYVVEKLERQNGGPFPPREEPLPAGRPQGSKNTSAKKHQIGDAKR